MFYEEKKIDKVFRLGDVITGISFAYPEINNPILDTSKYNCNIKVQHSHSVILMPCCSIGKENVISLTPLLEIKSNFMKNEYYKEDLTRINRTMPQKKMFSHQKWNGLSEEEKANYLSALPAYTLLPTFVYEPHDLLPEYKLKSEKIGYYMIDFKNICKVKCNSITYNRPAPNNCKLLQLTLTTRNELRTKLASFFGRTPKEDEI